jgi:hypothetical protein
MMSYFGSAPRLYAILSILAAVVSPIGSAASVEVTIPTAVSLPDFGAVQQPLTNCDADLPEAYAVEFDSLGEGEDRAAALANLTPGQVIASARYQRLRGNFLLARHDYTAWLNQAHDEIILREITAMGVEENLLAHGATRPTARHMLIQAEQERDAGGVIILASVWATCAEGLAFSRDLWLTLHERAVNTAAGPWRAIPFSLMEQGSGGDAGTLVMMSVSHLPDRRRNGEPLFLLDIADGGNWVGGERKLVVSRAGDRIEIWPRENRNVVLSRVTRDDLGRLTGRATIVDGVFQFDDLAHVYQPLHQVFFAWKDGHFTEACREHEKFYRAQSPLAPPSVSSSDIFPAMEVFANALDAGEPPAIAFAALERRLKPIAQFDERWRRDAERVLAEFGHTVQSQSHDLERGCPSLGLTRRP